MSIPYAELSWLIKGWITEHPYQTALHVVNGVVLLTPAAATILILSTLGFTSVGPAAGSTATAAMSYFGFVPAGGVIATLQSAAMGGYGAGVAAGAAQAGAVVSSAVGYLWGRK
ncbi:hypothetical protein K505DRAFT_246800 [Melanomma pulvis-pyrius CBS 109.77]|uniref:Uncharacterized protein n=1 Tax=Melanomma pulvis-pyrius CBS 109.77 TaxID=1314802 RepID=A0A6A6X7K2_9PLEO|nr:hypothetical protein K505DRAFT_246800 [Melanomma pulvis-pyrius CBS 109.77]